MSGFGMEPEAENEETGFRTRHEAMEDAMDSMMPVRTDFHWLVATVKDRGPDRWYRYSITGWICEGRSRGKRFSWSVPSLDDPRYDLAQAESIP